MARDIQGNVGDIEPMDIVLENVTTGVSGFQLTVQVADPSVATIESIVFPAYNDPLTGFSFNNAIPSASNRVDHRYGCGPGASNRAWLSHWIRSIHPPDQASQRE